MNRFRQPHPEQRRRPSEDAIEENIGPAGTSRRYREETPALEKTFSEARKSSWFKEGLRPPLPLFTSCLEGSSRKLGFRLEAFSETQRLRFVLRVFANASFGLLLLSGRVASLIVGLFDRGGKFLF